MRKSHLKAAFFTFISKKKGSSTFRESMTNTTKKLPISPLTNKYPIIIPKDLYLYNLKQHPCSKSATCLSQRSGTLFNKDFLKKVMQDMELETTKDPTKVTLITQGRKGTIS